MTVHPSDSTLRTLEEYRAAGNLGLLIDGEWVEATGDSTSDVVNPATGLALASIANASVADVDAAVKAARSARESWRRVSPAQRTHLLWKLS